MIFTYTKNILVLIKKKKSGKTNQELEKYGIKIEKNRNIIFKTKFKNI